MADLKKQIQEQVSRILLTMSSSDKDKREEDREEEPEVTEEEKDVIKKFLEENDVKILTDKEMYSSFDPENNKDPFDEPVLTWGQPGDEKNGIESTELSIELNPDNMVHMEKYYFNWRGHRMYVQKKTIGTDKFEIGIFQDEQE